eukprot:gene17228-biopygen8917
MGRRQVSELSSLRGPGPFWIPPDSSGLFRTCRCLLAGAVRGGVAGGALRGGPFRRGEEVRDGEVHHVTVVGVDQPSANGGRERGRPGISATRHASQVPLTCRIACVPECAPRPAAIHAPRHSVTGGRAPRVGDRALAKHLRRRLRKGATPG